jgi:drug/metabolite transporter (DMT)-like permease
MFSPSPLTALGSAAALGIADFCGGLAGRRTSAASVAAGMELSGLVMLPLAVWVLPTQWSLTAAGLAFTGGLVGGLGMVAFFQAMALNLVGVVAPIAGVVGAALPLLVGLAQGERLSGWQLGGVGAGLVAIALINGSGRWSDHRTPAGTGLAVLAGLAFGLFFVLFHAASFAGTTAFVSGRVGSSLAGIIAALVGGASFVPGRAARRLVVVAGALDGSGVLLYLYASRGGFLAVTALLASFYPAFTVIGARCFTNERMSRQQAVGAALATASVALIAL